MTVAELIAQLENLPMEAKVVTSDAEDLEVVSEVSLVKAERRRNGYLYLLGPDGERAEADSSVEKVVWIL